MVRIITLLAASLLMASCTPIRQYRCNYPDSPTNEFAEKKGFCSPEARAIREDCSRAVESGSPRNYFLGFVEFDDVGAYWDRGQRDYVLAELNARLSHKPHIVVVFVHGWNHNAHPCDSNVACFERVLDYLDQVEKLRARNRGEEPLSIAGIYVGWRGSAYKQITGSFLYNWSSFWGRKGAAHAVGAAGGLTDLLAKIEAGVCKEGACQSEKKNPIQRSMLITVGHSFGGALTYDAVSQVLLARSALARSEEDRVRYTKFGDIVVLVNPAFEATRAELLRERFKSFSVVRAQPALVIFASKADFPNRALFSAGRWLSNFYKRHRPSRHHLWGKVDMNGKDQGRRSRTAIGHYCEWWTHELVPVPGSEQKPSTSQKAKCECPYPTPEPRVIPLPSGRSRAAEEIRLGQSLLRPIKRGEAANGLNIISVDKDIIPGHNEIYTQGFVEALAAYMVSISLGEEVQ